MTSRATWIVGSCALLALSTFSAVHALGGITGADEVAPAAEDWNQWRGPNRDGVGDPAALPVELPASLTRLWQVEVGLGHASPVVVGDRVWLFSREGEQEVVRALSLTDGAEIWRQAYDAPFSVRPAARSHGPGPKSTPLVADGRLFTFGISGVLSAFDADSGAVLWRHDFEDQFQETAPVWGVAMSPILVDGALVAHVGWDGAGSLRAFDAATGAVQWANDEFIPGYASPILVETSGTRLLVTQSDKHIIAVDAASGETLWSMPFATDFQQNSVTPLAAGDRLVFSGLDEDLFAVRLAPVAGVMMSAGGTAPPGNGPARSSVRPVQAWEAAELWRNDRLPLYMNSPVLVGDRLFGMTHRRAGQFICVDVATGEPIWTSRGREGENAAIIALGDRVAFLTDEARLVIVAAGASAYEPLAEYEVADSPTWAHPAFTTAGVLIKDLETLTLWSFE